MVVINQIENCVLQGSMLTLNPSLFSSMKRVLAVERSQLIVILFHFGFFFFHSEINLLSKISFMCRYELILRIRVIYNTRALSQHHEHPCKTCLIIQWMQRYPHPQMRIRRPFPMSDPGQLQTIQAVTQDPIRRIGIKLHHRN